MKIPPIAYLAAIVLAGGVTWHLTKDSGNENPTGPQAYIQETSETPESLPEVQVRPTTVSGSTSLAALAPYLSEYGVTYEAKSSSAGLEELMSGKVSLAAVSRPLSNQERANGLVAHPIGTDAIAFVVDGNTASPENLSSLQVEQILTGQIKSWQEVGGDSVSIDLIVRGDGGTTDSVKEIFGLQSFSSSAQFLNQDSTTLLLNTLEYESIGFATAAQVCNQQTVLSLNVDGLSVTDPNYYPQREVYFVTKGQPGSNEAAVIDLASMIYENNLSPSAVCK